MSSETVVGTEASPIPLCVPELRGNEWAYVKECLDTGWVSSVGSYVTRFERETARRVGTVHAVATVNGTAALHTALLVAGVGPGDEVLVPALTFVAPANAVRYAGAHPVFMDVEPEYWQMDVAKAVDFLEQEGRWEDGRLINRTTGRRIRAVIPVHILGHPVDMTPLLAAARRYDLVVIEDASESLGARYDGEPVGHLGDAACFSFNGNKIITTGGGGMYVTDREDWAEKARYLTTQAKDDPIEYIHNEVGYNYRLTNVQAALGCAQLEQLDAYINVRCGIAARYDAALADVPGIRSMRQAPWAESIFWLSTVLVDEAAFGMDRIGLAAALAEQNIQTRPLWKPLHLLPPFADAQAYHVEVAPDIQRRALSLPSSTGLTEAQQETVIRHIRRLAR